MNIDYLIKKYLSSTPSFFKVKNIINSTDKIDHAAFRFLKDNNYFKYKPQPETYTFKNFNATAKWYKADGVVPRLFVSTYQDKYIPSISSYEDYVSINSQNSYLAWTILFEGHINHLALEVSDIELATETCIKNGIKMNYEGGLYKVSSDNLLIQTSTMADHVKYTFNNKKTGFVPYTFVELIERKREGFEQENARKIFTSTR